MAGAWRIWLADALAPEGHERLAKEAEPVEGTPAECLGSVDAVIVRSRTRVDAGFLRSGGPRLRVVGRAGVGVDNIDLAAARELGVLVVHAPEASTLAVAEYALALMLALARNLPSAHESLRSGAWKKADFVGSELHGKVLGILGFGRIGTALGVRARVLGMAVLAHDPYLGESEIRSRGAMPVSWETLLEQSDYLSLHAPLAEETRGLMNEAAFQRMKPGARLISTARGGIIDESALLQALESGRLAGAALDVFSTEPPAISALLQNPRIIATPHIAGQTHEAQARVALDIAEEVLAALKGEPLRWRVA
ncbi:MAG TPA: hydroxyacid dehydrogenase [Chloroflexi bacterium]|nr:hydroxyacid dehydrogenase [Chloroflexota bacterium]